MDLKDLTPKEETVTVTLKHPGNEAILQNNDKTDMTISFFLPHTKEARKVQHELTNRRIKKMASGKKLDLTAEDIEDLTVENLAKTTAEWNITYGGEKPKLTVAKAKEIFAEVFWIRQQVEAAVNDAMDFTKI